GIERLYQVSWVGVGNRASLENRQCSRARIGFWGVANGPAKGSKGSRRIRRRFGDFQTTLGERSGPRFFLCHHFLSLVGSLRPPIGILERLIRLPPLTQECPELIRGLVAGTLGYALQHPQFPAVPLTRFEFRGVIIGIIRRWARAKPQLAFFE